MHRSQTNNTPMRDQLLTIHTSEMDHMPTPNVILSASEHMPMSVASGTVENDLMPLAQDYLTPETDQMPPLISALLMCNQLPTSNTNFIPKTDDMPLPEIYLLPESDQMPFSATSPDQETDQIVIYQNGLPHMNDQIPLTSPLKAGHLPLNHNTLPHEHDCTLVSVPDTIQSEHSGVHIPFENDKIPKYIWDLHLESNPVPHKFDNLPHDYEEYEQSKSCFPCDTGQLLLSVSTVSPDNDQLLLCESDFSNVAEQLDMSNSCLSHDTEQLPQSESGLSHDTEHLPQSEPSLSQETEQPTQSKCNSSHNTEQLLQSESNSSHNTEQLPQPESGLSHDSDQLPKPESGLSHDVEYIHISEPGLPHGTEQSPMSESKLPHKTKPLPQPDPGLLHDKQQLPKFESGLCHNTEQLPLSQCGVPHDTQELCLPGLELPHDTDQLLLSESVLFHEAEQLPMPEPGLPHDIKQITQAQCGLPHDTEQLTQTESGLSNGNDQLLMPQSSLLHDTNKSPLSESGLPNDNEQLLQTESCLPCDTDHHPLLECHLPHKTDQLALSESCLYGETNHPHQSESDETLEIDWLFLSESCLPNETHQLPLSTSESHQNNKIAQDPLYESCLPPEINQLPQPISCISPEIGQPPLSEMCLPTESECLPLSETCLQSGMDQLSLCGSLLDFDNLPLSNTSLPYETQHLPQVTWDWAVSPNQTFLSESGILNNLPSESANLPNSDEEDPFSIFWLDINKECDHPNSETEQLPLSDDFLALSQVFSQLEAGQPPMSKNNGDQLCDPTDQLPISEKDANFGTGQLSVPEERKHLPQPEPEAMPVVLPSVTGQVPFSHTDLPLQSDCKPISDVSDQLSLTNLDKSFESEALDHGQLNDHLPLSCWSTNSEFDNGLDEEDPWPFYNLDLIFDSDHLCDGVEKIPPYPATDQTSPAEIVPSIINNLLHQSDVAGHQLSSELDLEDHHLYQSLLDLHIATQQLPLSQIDSSIENVQLLITDQMPPPNSYFEDNVLTHSISDSLPLSKTQLDSFTESNQLPKSQTDLPSEISQLPLIVVTDSLDESTEDIQLTQLHANTQFAKPPAALLIESKELPQSQIETPLEPAILPSSHCPLTPKDSTHEISQLPPLQEDPLVENTEVPDSDVTDQLPLAEADATIEDTQLPHSSAPTELVPSCMDSCHENAQLLTCDISDAKQLDGTQISASSPQWEECNLILGLPLDSDLSGHGDELARLRAVFDALDRDKDGFVKMEDFVQFATVYGAEQVKYLTGYLDPAGLGVINFRDFYRGISEIQNEDLDMQLYDMGYPSEEEPPACSVDFDDLAAFEVTEVTDSAYVGSESAYSECETFTDEDTGALAAQEDQENEGDGSGPRVHQPPTLEGLELSLCDISVVTVAGQEEQFEDFGEGAEPDMFNSHCEEEEPGLTEPTNCSKRLSPSCAPTSERQLLAPPSCPSLGALYCSQCHKHVNRLEDLSTRLHYLEMDSPDKRMSSRKEARRLHHSSLLEEDSNEQQPTDMAYDETDLTDKVLYLEERVSELERDAATSGEQQNRLRQENLQLLHRAHALEEQLKDQEVRSDELQGEEIRKHRAELRKMDQDRSYRLSSLKARVNELENENTELRAQLPSVKATTEKLEEEKKKLQDQVEDLQRQLQDHQEINKKLGGKLSKEQNKQLTEKERSQEVIEELRRELEQMQLMRLEMEHRLGLGNIAALQEYNSRTREAELEQEVRRLKQEHRILKEQNEELNGQIINLSIQGAKNLFSTTFSDSLAAEISSVSRDELMEAIQKQEEINLRLQDYIDRIIVAIMETNPAILEVKLH
ncbi:rab11 family-interacting protein 3 isoform 2-T2 [Discoglossus pictus]